MFEQDCIFPIFLQVDVQHNMYYVGKGCIFPMQDIICGLVVKQISNLLMSACMYECIYGRKSWWRKIQVDRPRLTKILTRMLTKKIDKMMYKMLTKMLTNMLTNMLTKMLPKMLTKMLTKMLINVLTSRLNKMLTKMLTKNWPRWWVRCKQRCSQRHWSTFWLWCWSIIWSISWDAWGTEVEKDVKKATSTNFSKFSWPESSQLFCLVLYLYSSLALIMTKKFSLKSTFIWLQISCIKDVNTVNKPV